MDDQSIADNNSTDPSMLEQDSPSEISQISHTSSLSLLPASSTPSQMSSRQSSFIENGSSLEGAELARQRTAQLLDGVPDDPNGTVSVVSGFGQRIGSWIRSAGSTLKEAFPGDQTHQQQQPQRRRLGRSTSSTNVNGRSNGKDRPELQDQTTPSQQVKVIIDRICSYPNCIRTLNIAVTRFHCRKCGGYYCGEHAGHPSMAMRLIPRTGEHDMRRGIWSRVCLQCFREWHYNPLRADPLPMVDRLAVFQQKRTSMMRGLWEEYHLLHDRLKTLREFHLSTATGQASVSGGEQRPKKEVERVFKDFQKTLVHWEKDGEASYCRSCANSFGPLQRRHHCRLCGRVICGDKKTCCLDVEIASSLPSIKMCYECHRFVVQRERRMDQLNGMGKQQVPVHGIMREIEQARGQVGDILPRFNEQLLRFENEADKLDKLEEQTTTTVAAAAAGEGGGNGVNAAKILQYQGRMKEARLEASTARDTLVLLFKHLESIAKRLKMLQGQGETTTTGTSESLERKLYANMYRWIIGYLQNNMFTLQMIPNLYRRPRPQRLRRQTESPAADIPLPRPANLGALENKMTVLLEQHQQLETFLADAVTSDRLDEVHSLRLALDEINEEMFRLNAILSSNGSNS